VIGHILEEDRFSLRLPLDHCQDIVEILWVIGIHVHADSRRSLFFSIEVIRKRLVDDFEITSLHHHAFETGGHGARHRPEGYNDIHVE
jgi:hypothetical protein